MTPSWCRGMSANPRGWAPARARARRLSRAHARASGIDARRLGVLALAEAPLDVLLDVLLGQFLLAFAESAVLVLLRRVGQDLLALAEAADALVLREVRAIALALVEALLGLLGLGGMLGGLGNRFVAHGIGVPGARPRFSSARHL